MTDIQYLTIPHLSIKQIRNVFKRVKVDPVSKCWVWQSCKDGQGYGFTMINKQRGRIHRIMYAWLVGPIPKGIKARRFSQLDHLCKNKSCCNPVHLELVTQRVNVLRGTSPVALAAKRMHCLHGHILTKTKNGKRRECKTCDSIRHKTRLLGPNSERYKQISRNAVMRYYYKCKQVQ